MIRVAQRPLRQNEIHTRAHSTKLCYTNRLNPIPIIRSQQFEILNEFIQFKSYTSADRRRYASLSDIPSIGIMRNPLQKLVLTTLPFSIIYSTDAEHDHPVRQTPHDQVLEHNQVRKIVLENNDNHTLATFTK
jgi:hypothetical protein